MKTFFKINFLALTMFTWFGVNIVNAQDASFSQHYASPLYLSPSFTGLSEGSRMSLHYRDQWPSIPGTYKTISFAFDHYLSDVNSGIGMQFYRDDAGGGLLVNQNIGLLYAYEIFVSDEIMIRPGLQFKLAQSFIDPSKGTLGSLYDPTDGTLVTGAGIITERDKISKFDAAASVMIYSNTYWGGVTVDHLVKSNVGFTDIESNTAMKITAFGGYKWIYKEGRRSPDQSLTFAVNYHKQADFNQLDLGTYWQYNPIELGLWYRGMPNVNAEGLGNQDALIAIVGVHLGQMRIGYSFDLTLSELAGNTGGAHEFSIMYTIPSSNKPKIDRRAVPCSQPGYTGNAPSIPKYRGRKRRMF